MNKESLVALVQDTKNKIVEFENRVFKERTNDYSIYRAETSIYLDTISFLEKMVQYELNAEEIAAIEENLKDIQKILLEDAEVLELKSEVVSEVATTETKDEFRTINFDTISEEVNQTSEDYSTIESFLTEGLPA